MTRAVANALWLPTGDRRSPNLWGRLDESPAVLYLKNAYCSLASVRRFHPDLDLVLIYDGDLPAEFRLQFEELGVRLEPVPFRRYLVPDSYPWKGGYYKLEAAEWLADHYESFLLLDTDTIVVGSLDEVFGAFRDRVGLYLIPHRESHPSRRIINAFGRLVDGAEHRVPHLGGEILGVDRSAAPAWFGACRRVFETLSQNWDHFHAGNPDQGDELILSLAAEELGGRTAWLNPHIARYWTLRGEANLSTRHILNPVEIWHLPLEKKAGILKLYDRLRRTSRWPSQEELIRLLHLEQGWATGLEWRLRKLKRWLFSGGRK